MRWPMPSIRPFTEFAPAREQSGDTPEGTCYPRSGNQVPSASRRGHIRQSRKRSMTAGSTTFWRVIECPSRISRSFASAAASPSPSRLASRSSTLRKALRRSPGGARPADAPGRDNGLTPRAPMRGPSGSCSTRSALRAARSRRCPSSPAAAGPSTAATASSRSLAGCPPAARVKVARHPGTPAAATEGLASPLGPGVGATSSRQTAAAAAVAAAGTNGRAAERAAAGRSFRRPGPCPAGIMQRGGP